MGSGRMQEKGWGNVNGENKVENTVQKRRADKEGAGGR